MVKKSDIALKNLNASKNSPSNNLTLSSTDNLMISFADSADNSPEKSSTGKNGEALQFFFADAIIEVLTDEEQPPVQNWYGSC